MFRFLNIRQKPTTVEDSKPEIIKITVSPMRVDVPDAPVAKEDTTKPCWYRLFGRPTNKISPEEVKLSGTTSADTNAVPKQTVKEPRRCCQWWKKKNRVIPAAGQDEVEVIKSLAEEEYQKLQEKRKAPPGTTKEPPKKKGAFFRALFGKKKRKIAQEPETTTECPKKKVEITQTPETTTTETQQQQQQKCFGFPNPIQFCYMNSCLQSLLTLVDFVEDISCQEQVWSLDPEATLIQAFIELHRNHGSISGRHKFRLLYKFHKAVSARAPEFQALEQKDAHEFLIAVLDQMRWHGPQLNMIAASMEKSYSCPVVDHLLFRIQNTRTCKSCGAGSTSEEEFTNLSLDLLPGGATVEQLLEDYLKETELEYRCQCGANMSGRFSSFINLPRVLILHLKRFRFTPAFTLRKCHAPVTIQRDIVVSSNQGSSCYSLVSTISHIGTEINGHYISDGVDPDVEQGNPIDRWFTYNDAEVIETSGASVCSYRKRLAYILFYKKQE